MVKLFIIAICQTITVKQKRFYKLSKVDMKEGALLAYYGMSVVSPIEGFPNVSHKHSRSMLIFSPLNISFEADFRAPLLTTYMLQFFPPAKPHAGRVVLLPHRCYNGTDWRPCGGDAEPYPLTSLVLAAPGPTFPSWLHVCETVAAKVCQARKKNQSALVTPIGCDTTSLSSTHLFFRKMNANSREQELYIPQMNQHMALQEHPSTTAGKYPQWNIWNSLLENPGCISSDEILSMTASRVDMHLSMLAVNQIRLFDGSDRDFHRFRHPGCGSVCVKEEKKRRDGRGRETEEEETGRLWRRWCRVTEKHQWRTVEPHDWHTHKNFICRSPSLLHGTKVIFFTAPVSQ